MVNNLSMIGLEGVGASRHPMAVATLTSIAHEVGIIVGQAPPGFESRTAEVAFAEASRIH
jgi:hypothetical protein